MFSVFKNAWKVADIRKKMLFTLLVVVIYRLGSQIPVPYIDSAALASMFSSSTVQSSLLGYFNMLSGDAFSKATLFALGVSPYITASIVVQLLTIVIPAWERWSKEGPEGQKKLTKVTRYFTIALAIVTAYGYYVTIRNYGMLEDKGVFAAFVICGAYTAGACIVTWIGEKIDDYGIGNGISIILFANICAGGAFKVLALFEYFAMPNEWYWAIIALVIMLAIIVFVVFISDSERRLQVNYAKRQVGRKMYGGNSTFLPIKVLMNGVMPVIFASSITSLPQTLALIFPGMQGFVTTWCTTQLPNGWIYVLVLFALIIAFAYFYTTISFNSYEIANNLRANGGTILGHRPGKPTADYIQKVVNKIVLIGAVCLSIIAILPILLSWTGSSALQTLVFGGTSLIIIVGVALETVRELESELMMRHYKGFLG